MTDSPITVLIVEDNQFMQATVERLVIDMDGIDVVATACNGRDAYEKAVETTPQVVLMDIVMPEMDGIEAARLIKLQLPQCRILMLSGDEADDTVVAAFAAGADGFCTKSTVLEQLESAIRAIASGAGWLDPVIGERILSGEPTASALRFTVYAKMGLSALEVDIFQLLRKRLMEDQIAQQLELTPEEVGIHISSIRKKLTGKAATKS